MIKAVIFDLDGILYDETEFVKSGFQAVSSYVATKTNLNSSEIYKMLIDNFNEGNRKKSFDNLIATLNIKGVTVTELVKIYRYHLPKISLFSDAQIELKQLINNNYKLGLVTDGTKKTQMNKINALKIKRFFKAIIINQNEKDKKPATTSFEKILKKFHLKPGEAVYIGDDPSKDFIGCKKMGLHTIMVRRGTGLYDTLRFNQEYAAEYLIPNLIALEELLSSLNNEKNYNDLIER